MTKIVFFDIDGTLLDKKRRIPASAKLAILELKKQGIIPAIATGRPPFLIKEILEELAIDTHISLNGQYVVHKGEIVYQNPMEAHLVERLAQAAEINKQGIAFAGSEMIAGNSLTTTGSRKWQKKLSRILPFSPPTFLINVAFKRSDKIHGNRPVLKEYYENRLIYQCMLHATEEHDAYYSQEFPDCSFMRWNPYSVDVCPNNGSKAVGITKLMQFLEFPIEASVAFGDGLNDQEMLKIVGTGVAMENGREELKAIADYITDKPEDDGILNGLRLLEIIK